jgi:exonuclease VII large subunit
LNELNQLLDALSTAKENMRKDIKARTTRASSLTPTVSTTTTNDSTTKNAKSIDDLIESLNNATEATKSTSKKKSSSTSGKHSSKKSTATKELEDLMESLSNFKLPSQPSSSLTRVHPRASSSLEQLSTKKTTPIPQQYPLCYSCQKPIVGQVLILKI